MIARVLMTGVIAGLVAGLAVAALQHVTTTPLILAAEVYETAQHAHDGAEAGDALSGLSRTAATSVATVAVSIGYALILLAAMLLSGDAIAPRRAALWGACAFAATGLATSLGLAPQLPGMAETDLAARQIWWLATALCDRRRTVCSTTARLSGGKDRRRRADHPAAVLRAAARYAREHGARRTRRALRGLLARGASGQLGACGRACRTRLATAVAGTGGLVSGAKIPATIVTGFLGAGKTTLIRHVLENAKDRRLALVINEFGDVGVDGEILRACGIDNCPEENIVELANGCLCCTVADDFVPAIEALLAHEKRPDHIIIETSGLALPKPLVKAFDWPAIRSKLTVDGVIAVIDGKAVAEGRFADDLDAIAQEREETQTIDHDNPLEEVFEDQLACADLVILNKTDLLDAAEERDVANRLAQGARQGAKVVRAYRGRVDPLVLLGLSAAAEDDLANRPSHHDADAEP